MKVIEQVGKAICEEDGNNYYSHLRYTAQAKVAIQTLIDAEWPDDIVEIGYDKIQEPAKPYFLLNDVEQLAKAMLKQMIVKPEK